MKSLISLIIFIFSITTFANTVYNHNLIDKETESWYLMVGLGGSIPYYFDDLKGENNSYEKYLSINLDILGIYLTINENIILGVLGNGTSERYEKNDIVEDILGNKTKKVTELDISAVTIAVSAKYFINKINEGFFLRGDLGISSIVIKTEDKTSLDGERKEETEGYGFLLGGGYAYPITRGTSLLFSTNYTLRKAKSEVDKSRVLTHSAINFTIGFLW